MFVGILQRGNKELFWDCSSQGQTILWAWGAVGVQRFGILGSGFSGFGYLLLQYLDVLKPHQTPSAEAPHALPAQPGKLKVSEEMLALTDVTKL